MYKTRLLTTDSIYCIHAKKHFLAIVNKLRLRGQYRELPKTNYVYFPLHVPADMALTIRAPEYLDQCALIAKIAKSLKPGLQLLIKEHPAMVGAIPAKQILKLLKENPNVRILKPTINNLQVMGGAEVVYTVNSKAGSEAVALGTPVVLFSDSFYQSAPGVNRMKNAKSLGYIGELSYPDSDGVEKYFAGLWEVSHQGELYQLTDDNFKDFGKTIISFFN